MDFKNKKVVILGFGTEGISSLKFLKNKNTDITILDKREKGEMDQESLQNS